MPVGAPTFAEPNSPEHRLLVENLKKERSFLTEENLEEVKIIIAEKEKIESTPCLKKTIPDLLVGPLYERRLTKMESIFSSIISPKKKYKTD